MPILSKTLRLACALLACSALAGASLALPLLAGPDKAAEADAPASTPAADPAAEAAPTGAAGLVQRLDAVSGRLAEINDHLRTPAPDLAGIAVALPGKAKEAEAVLGRAEALEATQEDLVELNATVQKLKNLDRIFDKWRTRLKEEVELLDPWREQLRTDADFLRKVAGPEGLGAEGADLVSGVIRTRLTTLADGLEATRQPLLKRLDVVVAADVRVGELQNTLRELQGQLDAARLSKQEKPLAITAPPLWKPPEGLRAPADTARQNLNTLVEGARDFIDANPGQLTAAALLFLLLLASVVQLRHSILARGETEADELLTQYPYAVAVLIWIVVAPVVVLPDIPLGIALLRGLVVVVLLWRLVPVLVTPAEARPVKGLLLLSVAFLGQIIFFGDDWYGRVVTVVLGLLALLLFRELARRSRVEPGGRAVFRRAIHGVAVVAPVAVAAGLIAELVGARSLGQQAIGGIVFLTLALCTLLVADIILRSVLDAWVSGPGARWLRGVRNWPDVVRSWGRRLIRLVLLVALVRGLPTFLPMLEPVWKLVGDAMATPLNIGNVGLSLGNVLWFFVGIAIALGVARFVRFALDEDVLSRMPLAMGAASAASRLIYYALVVAGIMFALAASGVELAKLTIVISALSVGIGFGLQNVVNNFVSGLILAFERPVREGDQVTLGQTTGQVESIGLRATRIRTGDGAEVIVPNAILVSGEVTNWTLTDRARRIDITIGVDHDSDPVHVREILLAAVAGLEGVAEKPAPMTAFRGFGASSLDFSLLLWTYDIDDRLSVESEARTRVLAALREAGIHIPFPRMDLRVRDGVPPARPAPPGAGS